jgi:hypothetical protein
MNWADFGVSPAKAGGCYREQRYLKLADKLML